MNTVADQILKQFAENFAARVGAIQIERTAPAETGRAPAGAAAPPAAASGTLAPSVQAASELNGLALAWAIFRDWLRGLFDKKAA